MTEETWDRRTEWPLNVLAVAFLAAYAWPILQPSLASALEQACSIVAWGTWAAFGVDYVVRLAMADSKWGFVRAHPLDLLVLVLPILRPLRALRAVMALSRLNRRATASFHGQAAT